MAGKPFDATIKDLIEADAAAWAALVSAEPPAQATLVDADISSVTAAADKVLRVKDGTGTWLLDLEPQSGHAGDSPEALLLYSTLLEPATSSASAPCCCCCGRRPTPRQPPACWRGSTPERHSRIWCSATAW